MLSTWIKGQLFLLILQWITDYLGTIGIKDMEEKTALQEHLLPLY